MSEQTLRGSVHIRPTGIEINRWRAGQGYRQYGFSDRRWRQLMYLARKHKAFMCPYEVRTTSNPSSPHHAWTLYIAWG